MVTRSTLAVPGRCGNSGKKHATCVFRRTGKPKASVVVAVVRAVVVALSRPRILSVVVPRTAALHALATIG
jgi:hypothetical protein